MAANRATAAKTTKKSTSKNSPKRSASAAAKPRKAPNPPAKAVKSKANSAPAVKKAVIKAKAPAAPAPKKAPAAVTPPTKSATGKAASGLSKAELEHFRELLLERRREILGDVGSMESEAFKIGSNLSNMPIHMADVGTDNFEQEFTLGLIESERQMLREIQEALARLENGTYGICQGTGKQIPKLRLEAVPWTKYTVEFSRAVESGSVKAGVGRRADAARDDDDD